MSAPRKDSAARPGSPAAAARRRFLNGVAAAAGGACLLTLGSGLFARHARALPAEAIRKTLEDLG